MRKRKFENLDPCEVVKIPYSKIMLEIMEVVNDISPGVNPEEFLNSIKKQLKKYYKEVPYNIFCETYDLDKESEKSKELFRYHYKGKITLDQYKKQLASKGTIEDLNNLCEIQSYLFIKLNSVT